MIAGALRKFTNRWCKREHIESNALNSWNVSILHNLLDEKYVDVIWLLSLVCLLKTARQASSVIMVALTS